MLSRSEEPVVHRDEPELPRADVSCSEFEIGAPTLEEEVERRKSPVKRALKSPLTAVLESWLPSILHCRFFHISGSFPVFFLGDADTIPAMSGTEEVSTGVETDGQLRGRHIVVTRKLVPLAGGPQHDVPEAVHSRKRSRELLERAFDDGNSCALPEEFTSIVPSWLQVFTIFNCVVDQFVADPAATVIHATGHQLVSLCRSVCEEEKAQWLPPLMNS